MKLRWLNLAKPSHHVTTFVTSERLIGIKPRKGFQDRLGHSRHGTFAARHKTAPLWASGNRAAEMNLEEFRNLRATWDLWWIYGGFMEGLCLKKSQISISQRMALGGLHYPPCFTKPMRYLMFTVPGPINAAAVCIWKCLRCLNERASTEGLSEFYHTLCLKKRQMVCDLKYLNWHNLAIRKFGQRKCPRHGETGSPPTKALGTARRLPGTDRPTQWNSICHMAPLPWW